MPTKPSKDDALNRLDKFLWIHFPDDPAGNPPWWGQRPYRDDLFKLCMEAYGVVNRDCVAEHVRSHWNIQRQCPVPEDLERDLERLVDAWGEWQFAYHKLVDGG